MRRVAVFVDAGYFWVQACNQVLGRQGRRNEIVVDYGLLRESFLQEVANQFPGATLLRVNWYDGPGGNGSKTSEHRSIDLLNDFKLRLGTRNSQGAQKGVDGLIIADLISLTQLKAITDALLVTGDADITPGVVAAQGLGLRIHLLSIGTTAATSPYLAAEVDFKHSWGMSEVSKFASQPQTVAATQNSVQTASAHTTPPPVSPSNTSATSNSPSVAQSAPTLAQIANTTFSAIQNGAHATTLLQLKQGTKMLPPQIDGQLLHAGKTALARALTESEKRTLRQEFKSLLPA